MFANDLPYDKICLFSDLPMATCAHCRGDDDLTVNSSDDDGDYELTGRIFVTAFHSRCTIDPDHRIRRGENVAFVRHADNPMLPVKGVACQACVRDLPRARN